MGAGEVEGGVEGGWGGGRPDKDTSSRRACAMKNSTTMASSVALVAFDSGSMPHALGVSRTTHSSAGAAARSGAATSTYFSQSDRRTSIEKSRPGASPGVQPWKSESEIATSDLRTVRTRPLVHEWAYADREAEIWPRSRLHLAARAEGGAS